MPDAPPPRPISPATDPTTRKGEVMTAPQGPAMASPTKTEETGPIPTPVEDTMGIQTRTDFQTDTERKVGRITALVIIGALILAILAAWLIFFRPNATDPTPAPPPAASATPSPSAPSAEQQAYASAEQSYRAWSASTISADAAQDASKLDTAVATATVVQQYADNVRMNLSGFEGTIRSSEEIRSVSPLQYSGTSLKLSVCALRDTRFIDRSGKDVTVDRTGAPVPPSTKPLAQTVAFTLEGATWRVSEYVIDPTDGVAC